MNEKFTDYITAEEYMGFRKAVGWAEFPLEEASEGLKNSFICCLRQDDKPIALKDTYCAVEREFDEGGADRLGEGFHGDFAIQVFDSDVVTHASLAEAQRGDETQVEIATKAFAANDAHGETRRLQGLNVVDIEVLRARDVVVAVGP